MSSIVRIVLCISAAPMVAAGQNAQGLQLTARQLYYFAPTNPAPTTTAPAATPAPVKAPPKKSAAKKKPTTPDATAAEMPRSTSPADLANAPMTQNAMSEHPRTAMAPASGQPLGLKYTVLKSGGGSPQQIPTTTVFHAGDKIRFSVQANSPGYLYIISQGSSGTWKPMFPSREIAGGSNRIEALQTYTMPPRSNLVFDEQSGTERIFIVLSREPEPDLEKLIYSLQGKSPTAGTAEAPKEPALIVASAIDDSTVGRLRKTYSRDLVVEPVTNDTPGDQRETATYVVNPSGSAESRVVADISLVHQ